jgi:hypothetical protein
MAEAIQPLLLQNWRETALDHDRIPLDPDFSVYSKADLAGTLHITAAWDGEHLAGYFILFVIAHPHYKSTKFALMDVYFLEPKYRKAANGLRLIAHAEVALKAKGVKEIIANTKVKLDMSGLFTRLGWRFTARVYTKLLG